MRFWTDLVPDTQKIRITVTSEEKNVNDDIFCCPLHLPPHSMNWRQKQQRQCSLQWAVCSWTFHFCPGLTLLLLEPSEMLGPRCFCLLDPITSQFGGVSCCGQEGQRGSRPPVDEPEDLSTEQEKNTHLVRAPGYAQRDAYNSSQGCVIGNGGEIPNVPPWRLHKWSLLSLTST